MGKAIHNGLRKPEEATSQDGWTVTLGGLLGKDYVPKVPGQEAQAAPQPQAEQRPAWAKLPYQPPSYQPRPEEEDYYPPNPKDRKKLPPQQ
jgi:hypothetical protein